MEVTRSKIASSGKPVPSTLTVARSIYRREGVRGLNKGVNAVALRQMTGWMSRIGITRFNEGIVRWATGKGQTDKLSNIEKIAASCGGGALSCWNQPLEVSLSAVILTTGHPNRDAVDSQVRTACEWEAALHP